MADHTRRSSETILTVADGKKSITDTSPLSKDKVKLLNIGDEDLKLLLKYHNVTEEDVTDMVRSIRDWLKKQPHLPGDKLHDQKIIGRLILRGFSIEKVKSSLDDYFRAPHVAPEIVCQQDPLDPIISEYLKRGYWISMPKKTPEQYRVSVFRMVPGGADIPTAIKIGFMILEYRTWNDINLGDCWIFDVEHTTLQETLQITPVLISRIVFLVLANFGSRLKSIHVLNVPSIALPLLKIFKSIMKTKLGDRIYLTTKEELPKHFSKECLPEEYGGNGGTFQEIADEWRNTLQSDAWRQYFLERDDIRSDESKRLTPLPDSEIFGTDGSFRKISID